MKYLTLPVTSREGHFHSAGRVISAPEVMAHITDGKAVIDGMPDIEAAAELATLIKAGAAGRPGQWK